MTEHHLDCPRHGVNDPEIDYTGHDLLLAAVYPECICERLHNAEQRILDAAWQALNAAYTGHWDEERNEIFRDADPNIGLNALAALREDE